MSIINFYSKVERQININKRAEFVSPNQYGEKIEEHNDFPQRYKVIIGKETFSGGLYKQPRPYYYFAVHKNGHNAFFNLVRNKEKFYVTVDLAKKIVHIE